MRLVKSPCHLVPTFPMRLTLGNQNLELDPPVVMGILNVTPDSFSDGGHYVEPRTALERARRMRDAGAAIIDIGGESTRPGAEPVTAAEEIERVMPIVEPLVADGVTVSVDTSKAEVMRCAIEAGVAMINDVNALRAEGALEVCAGSSVAVCVMHMQGEPRSMQSNPQYGEVVGEIYDFLALRIKACLAAGIERGHIVIDPGFGFGKTLTHNLQLLRNLERFTTLGVPVLAGLSRKSLLGPLTGRRIDARLAGSVALATLAVASGASIIRAHDVAETVDAVAVASAVRSAN